LSRGRLVEPVPEPVDDLLPTELAFVGCVFASPLQGGPELDDGHEKGAGLADAVEVAVEFKGWARWPLPSMQVEPDVLERVRITYIFTEKLAAFDLIGSFHAAADLTGCSHHNEPVDSPVLHQLRGPRPAKQQA